MTDEGDVISTVGAASEMPTGDRAPEVTNTSVAMPLAFIAG